MTKKILFVLAVAISLAGQLMAQSCYWVFLTDKAGTTFDPYTYFDAKAIERYRLNNADLYDISNYPLNSSYVDQVDALATEEVGSSRWLNAVAVMATQPQIDAIARLACVKEVSIIATDMQIASYRVNESEREYVSREATDKAIATALPALTPQLYRFQGDLFRNQGIDAKGVRIAVFDGGFPRVNTHAAFKHLRDNGQIKATWNFCNKKENVYGWNSHGTMVLSCIAGILDGRQLGLATGAEFLLARTEINTEPFKEEVWWAQAAEWADKNGADVINSSLGYGKQRHFTYEMDGRSYVAKAANMAARKGMLICNSAGNEGEDSSWKTIITPADADSVLCVAGIDDQLDNYRHISFSSYGPGADGRLKPNVAAFGHALVAGLKSDSMLTDAYGTSFASPLTAGFCACAWQTRKGYTAMQMKEEIERSCDRYPYFDYSLGYGVPQASYFTDKEHQAVAPTFTLVDTSFIVCAVFPPRASNPSDNTIIYDRDIFSILKSQLPYQDTANVSMQDSIMESAGGVDVEPTVFIDPDSILYIQVPDTTTRTGWFDPSVVFYKLVNDTNGIDLYGSRSLSPTDKPYMLAWEKRDIGNHTLWVNYLGYTASYRLPKEEVPSDVNTYYSTCGPWHLDENYKVSPGNVMYSDDNTYEDLVPSTGSKGLDGLMASHMTEFNNEYLFSYFVPTASGEMPLDAFFAGFEYTPLRFTKLLNAHYGFGLGLSWGYTNAKLTTSLTPAQMDLNTSLSAPDEDYTIESNSLFRSYFGMEVYQRVRMFQGTGLMHKGLFWDLGAWLNVGYTNYHIGYQSQGYPCEEIETVYRRVQIPDVPRWQWGVQTRVVWDFVGVYARYNMTGMIDNGFHPCSSDTKAVNLPRLQLGFLIQF